MWLCFYICCILHNHTSAIRLPTLPNCFLQYIKCSLLVGFNCFVSGSSVFDRHVAYRRHCWLNVQTRSVHPFPLGSVEIPILWKCFPRQSWSVRCRKQATVDNLGTSGKIRSFPYKLRHFLFLAASLNKIVCRWCFQMFIESLFQLISVDIRLVRRTVAPFVASGSAFSCPAKQCDGIL